MDAIGPDVDVTFRRQIAPLPRGVFVKPTVLQPADGGCRQPGSILAEQRRQSLGEVAGGDTLQVEDRQQRLDRFRAAHVGRQDRRREPDAVGVGSVRLAIAYTRLADGDRTDTGHHLAFRQVTVAHDALVAVRGLQIGMLAEKARDLGLHRLGQQGTRPVAQDFGELIVEHSWLNQLGDVIVGHGISLLRWRSGGVRHPHDMPPFRFPPSPTSGDSSRANWKGFLRLSLVTCPVALYPATSDSEKISFNQINRKTGHRIKYAKVDADTGEEVSNDDIMKGYKVDTDTYIEVTKDELENIALESTRTIDIDQFVPRSEIDDLYLVRPYYIVPDGKVGHDAYAVIRETIRSMDKVALARLVLTSREHVISLEARDKGLMGMLLRYPYEVRDQSEYFDDIQDVKITKDMLDLAKHIVEQKSGHFEPAKFEDHYEAALTELINRKRNGERITSVSKPVSRDNVISLMDALKRSISGKPAPAAKPAAAPKAAKGKKPRKAAAGQREMLLPISGKRAAKAEEKRAPKEVKAKARARKTG